MAEPRRITVDGIEWELRYGDWHVVPPDGRAFVAVMTFAETR